MEELCYYSTRDLTKSRPSSFEQALFSGYASDGGLYVPSNIVKIDKNTLISWSQLSYTALVQKILRLYIPLEEIPTDVVNSLVEKAFAKFTLQQIVQCKHLKDGLNVLDLFHGPTLAFKDIALSIVGQLLNYFLQHRKKHINVLVGTSGDTGSAAIESVRGLSWIDIIVLLPRGRCTPIQELQMTTVLDKNVHVIRVDGTSDDLDKPIKQCFADERFVQTHNLCCINSVNWGRIMCQIANFFFAYLQVCPMCDQDVEIVVPTGACGNVTAGSIAQKMGLRIQLVCAVNSNDIVSRSLNTGDFSIKATVVPTLAPAMDIQMPYNMERLIYIFSDGNAAMVKKILEEVENENRTIIPERVLILMKRKISSYVVNDTGICLAIRRCWKENEYILCPHTATAVKYHYDVPKKVLRVCFATASPGKFEEAVNKAGLPQFLLPEKLQALVNKPTKYSDWEKGQDWTLQLRTKIEAIDTAKQAK